MPDPKLNIYNDDDVGVRPEDVFYKRLVYIHINLSRPKVLLMEVGDEDQALRVAGMAMRDGNGLESRRSEVEIWRDFPDGNGEKKGQKVVINGIKVLVRGEGEMRVVVVRSFDRVWGAQDGTASR